MAASRVTVLMVVGAGRGPLVRCALQAAEEAGRQVRVYAVEKNPNAVVTLLSAKEAEWGDRVTVVSCDMRRWEAPEKADIMVSELLGSFGDNELSPECLDGAQRYLKDDGISIPCSYTSYLAPLTTPRLHTELTAQDNARQLQMPYVVMLWNAHRLAPPQPCFTFHHPNPDCASPRGPDNSRYIELCFTMEEAGRLHGFAGYFDTVLYGDVTLSIHPDTHSEGMFSWFPIYFPLLTPVYAAKGAVVQVSLWRKTGPAKVWYEWALVSPAASPIHNACGKAYAIGL